MRGEGEEEGRGERGEGRGERGEGRGERGEGRGERGEGRGERGEGRGERGEGRGERGEARHTKTRYLNPSISDIRNLYGLITTSAAADREMQTIRIKRTTTELMLIYTES